MSQAPPARDSTSHLIVFNKQCSHQTLDAIDGKQARRTNTSSSLGTLFDHGCDIITGVRLSYMILLILRTIKSLSLKY